MFYEASIEDSFDALLGYFERQRDEERIQRRAALMIVSPWVDKKVDPYKWWPIAGDEEIKDNVKNARKQKLRSKLLMHRHNEALKKNNGG